MENTENEYPVARVPAVIQATGILRFDISHEQTKELHEKLSNSVKSTSEDEDVVFDFTLTPPQATVLGTRVEDLLANRPMVGLAQIETTDNPEYGVEVMVSEDTLKRITMDTPRSDEPVTHEFTITRKAAWLVKHQLEAALNGADDPIEVVEMEHVRETLPEPQP